MWRGNWEGAAGKGPMPQHVLKLPLAKSAFTDVGAFLLHSVAMGSAAGRWFGAEYWWYLLDLKSLNNKSDCCYSISF